MILMIGLAYSIGFVHEVLEFKMKVRSKWFQLVQPV